MKFTPHKTFLKVKDFSVSKENFELLYDENLDLLKTHPQPSLSNLPKYYESEDYISHTDGKRTLFEKLYQFVKNISLKKKINLINNFHPNKGKILDIGAGTGDFLVYAKNNQWEIDGFEPNEKAKAIAITKGVSFIENLEVIPEASYDVITMWHVLEHVPDLEKQLNILKRIIKPNGSIIIAVPNFKSFDAKYYGNYWAAFDVPRHLWHFSKTAIKKLFLEIDFDLIKIVPMKFDSYYVSLLSEKYKNGKMNFLRAFYIGWLSNLKASKNFEFSSHIYVLQSKKINFNAFKD